MKFKKIPTYFFITFACCLWLSVTTMAQQTDNGTLAGTITDQQGAVIANATVTATSADTGLKRIATTNEEGRWTISSLKPGSFEIKVEAAGFQTTVQKNSIVTASNTNTVDITVGISEGINQVDVIPDDRDSAINQEPNGQVVSTTSGEKLEAVPVIRGTFGLLQIDPNVSSDLANTAGNSNGNGEPSVNGGRTTSLGVTIDGVDATNISGTGTITENFSLPPEAVEEVKLFSNLYPASIGRNGGGSVQVVTRHGTNKFSGTAFIYAQNEKFNANDFFFNRDGIDRQRARRLEGGFTIGGPIIKDRLQFFGVYQKTDANTAYVPTASSFVVLPEALAFATDRSPRGLARAFGLARGDGPGQGFNRPGCVATSRLPIGLNFNQLQDFCIDPFGPGYKLFAARNPITGGFLIPTLTTGRYERLFVNRLNNTFNPIGLDPRFDLDRLPVQDIVRESGIPGGNSLVRFRNVFPADFAQDLFTTRLDYNLLKGDNEGHNVNNLYGTFLFTNFPASEPFTVDTLVSPFPLVKDDRNRTLAINDTHVFNANLLNEARFGYFFLNNSRGLDERLLIPELTNTGLGIDNPARFFAPGPTSDRCGRVSGRAGNIQDFQVCAPNDVYNQRKQVTLTFADNITYIRGDQTLRFGVEHKRNAFDTNFPEEQGGDFENLNNFNELLLGYIPEADTSFGITDKSFLFNDLSFYASDDWKVGRGLTVNLGLRWDWFGLPIEKNGRFANFDPSLLTNPDDLRPGFLLPSNVVNTGVVAVDGSLPTINKAKNKHTLNGEDLNNFAPRFGFAWSPFKNEKTKISGGYGIFYDRPSGAFINTVYKNYPFFREIEEKFDFFNPFALQYDRAFTGRNPLTPFSQYLPFRIQYANVSSVASPLQLFDNTPVTTVISGQSFAGGRAEALEFRAIDRDLKTPLIQQWNLGIQQDLGKGWVVETRYVGTRGQQLLLAVGFNQAYDLNDPSTPDYIFERFNRVYLQASPNNVLNPGATARQRGCGLAFGNGQAVLRPIPGLPYPFGPTCSTFVGDVGNPSRFDYNFDAYNNRGSSGTDLIETELRVPYLGFDPVESIQLQSRGYSFYHAAQLNISKRFSKGIGFNASYTFSKSIDIGSTDPGSTAASGRPDTPSLGLVVQGDQRNLNSNRALSDFDRTHRFSTSFVWTLPSFGSKSKFLKGWQLSGIGQWQSGTPFTILASDVEFVQSSSQNNFENQFLGLFPLTESRRIPGTNDSVNVTRNFYNAGRASGTLYNAAFARPNVRNLELLKKRNCSDLTRCYFNIRQNSNDPDAALLPAYGRFGNLGRNILRGPSQKRFDLSLQKTTKLSERLELELKWDIFNLFNFVNFANPNADLSDETDFGQITNTVGAPRVMQFGAKIRF